MTGSTSAHTTSAHTTSGGRLDRVVKWVDYRLPIFTLINKELNEYPTPKNLNYFWNFGSIAGIFLVIMIVSGIYLSMHYTPHVDYAFDSVQRIMREVNFGDISRYIHMNGASFFFIAIYIHIFRGFYYGSYKAPRELLWQIGVLIFLLMMGTAFLGYTLVWGKMSLAGAQVITNLVGVVPFFGEDLLIWLWGGYSIENPTLNRFFSLHFLLPFIIVGLVIAHLWALHVHGSNNPLGIDKKQGDTISFHPYYTIKDAFGLGMFLVIFCLFVFYAPEYLGHAINNEPADPLVTPEHIVPEWYFLPFYAMLRAMDFPFLGIPAKTIGAVIMGGSIMIWFVLPWLDTSKVRSCRFRPIYKWFVFLLAADFIFLGWLGSQLAEEPYVTFSKIGTFWYFFHFLILLPVLGKFETPHALPPSISAAVIAKEN